MSNILILYGINLLIHIISLVELLAFICVTISVIFFLVGMVEGFDDEKDRHIHHKICLYLLYVGITAAFIRFFCPDKELIELMKSTLLS